MNNMTVCALVRLGSGVVFFCEHGLQGSHLNLSQTSAQRHGGIFFSITRL